MSAWRGWGKRPSAGARRDAAARAVAAAAKRGRALSPVTIAGRTIARTFWGRAWCDNLERYRDFAYRLERGRTYVRTGAVIDLQIEAGRVRAQVQGSSRYRVEVGIDAVATATWAAIRRDCAGSIGSLVDLLAGTLSEDVMTRLCADGTGLFPSPREIHLDCTCPDVATMCKHVAATLYGVGARLDDTPALLFALRQVSADELIAEVARAVPAQPPPRSSGRVLAGADLSAMFGLDLAEIPAPPTPQRRAANKPAKTPAKKPPATRKRRA